MSDLSDKYNFLVKCLKEMKEEYKITPSKFLLKKIELVQSKIIAIDKLLPRNTNGGGEYQPTPSDNTNFNF